jgi:uncharacterized membrane protein YtjA (UPF0391 family)
MALDRCVHQHRGRRNSHLSEHDGRVACGASLTGDRIMLRWALIFFVVALVAAILGFTGIALAAAGVAKILFFIFVILFALSLLSHVARRP